MVAVALQNMLGQLFGMAVGRPKEMAVRLSERECQADDIVSEYDRELQFFKGMIPEPCDGNEEIAAYFGDVCDFLVENGVLKTNNHGEVRGKTTLSVQDSQGLEEIFRGFFEDRPWKSPKQMQEAWDAIPRGVKRLNLNGGDITPATVFLTAKASFEDYLRKHPNVTLMSTKSEGASKRIDQGPDIEAGIA